MEDRKNLIEILNKYKREIIEPSIEEFKDITTCSLDYLIKEKREKIFKYVEKLEEIKSNLFNYSYAEDDLYGLEIGTIESLFNDINISDMETLLSDLLTDYISYIEENKIDVINKLPSNWSYKFIMEFEKIKEDIEELHKLELKYEKNTFTRVAELDKLIDEHNSLYKDYLEVQADFKYKEEELEGLELEEFESEEDFDDYYDNLKEEVDNLNEVCEKLITKMKDIGDVIKYSTNDVVSSSYEQDLLDTLVDKVGENFEYNIIEEIKENIIGYETNWLKSLSKQYKENLENNNTIGFLKNKNILENVKKFKIKTQSEYKEIYLFSDNSLGYIDNQNNFQSIYELNYKYKDFAENVFSELIKEKLRKKPKYISIFNKVDNKTEDISKTYHAIEEFLKYENLFKSKNIDIEKTFHNKDAEKIIDLIIKEDLNHKVKNYAKSIMSNKYKHLLTEKNLVLFKIIYELDIPKQHLQDNIGKKLASFKDAESLNENLKIYINSINNFTMEGILLKRNNTSTEIISSDNNKLILKVNDYYSSKKLGSNSWCIVRYENYFDTYCKTNNQYFIYDFNKDSKDKESLIGITITKNGKNRAAHYKNDITINDLNSKEIIKEIILKDFDRYKENLSEEDLKIYENKIKSKNKLKI